MFQSAEEEKPKEPVVVEKASGEPKKAEDPTTKKRPRKNEDVIYMGKLSFIEEKLIF